MEQPPTAHERADLVTGLLDRIEHFNALLAQRRANPNADPLAVEEFTYRRNKYVGQLALLLDQYGLVLQLPTPPRTAQRVAA